MARETRIGIVLMMLLTGVFGFLVYQRWNSQQPTILAVASEIRDQVEEDDAQAKPEAAKKSAEAKADGKDDASVPGPDSPKDDFFANLGPPREKLDISADAAPSRPDPFAAPAHLTGKVDVLAKPHWPGRKVSRKDRVPTDSPFADDSQSPFGTPSSPFNNPAPSAGTLPTEAPVAEATHTEAPAPGMTKSGTAKIATAEQPPGISSIPGAPPSSAPIGAKTELFGPQPVAMKEVTPEAPSEPTAPTNTTEPSLATKTTATEAMSSSLAGVDGEKEPITDTVNSQSDFPFKFAKDSFKGGDPFKESNPREPTGLAAEGPKAVTLKEDPFASFTDSGSNVGAVKENDPFLADGKPVEKANPPSSFGEDPGSLDAAEPDRQSNPPVPTLKAPSQWTKSSPFSTPASADPKPSLSPKHTSDGLDRAAPTSDDNNDIPRINIEDYIVKTHDNYWTISQTVYGSPIYAHALAQYNADLVPKPRDLTAGTKVSVPPVKVLKERYAVLIATGSRAAARTEPRGGFFMTETGQPAYRVEESDTLKDIARSHLARTSRWIQIYEMNRDVVKNPESLKVGTVLRLPIDASRVKLVQGKKIVK